MRNLLEWIVDLLTRVVVCASEVGVHLDAAHTVIKVRASVVSEVWEPVIAAETQLEWFTFLLDRAGEGWPSRILLLIRKKDPVLDLIVRLLALDDEPHKCVIICVGASCEDIDRTVSAKKRGIRWRVRDRYLDSELKAVELSDPIGTVVLKWIAAEVQQFPDLLSIFSVHHTACSSASSCAGIVGCIGFHSASCVRISASIAPCGSVKPELAARSSRTSRSNASNGTLGFTAFSGMPAYPPSGELMA